MDDGNRSTPPDRSTLALVRTDLANERTLLAYGRTSLMLAGTGGTLIKFFADVQELRLLGLALIALGGLVLLIGLFRFVRLHRRLH